MARQGNVGAMREASLAPDYYLSESYFEPEQLYSMAHQIRELHRFRAKRILEIGVGSGFVSAFLRRSGAEVVTADINPQLQPDLCCPMSELPERLKGERFDLVSCCEVLEHMPFDQFGPNLDILHSLARDAFITLPGHFPWLGLNGRLGLHNRFIDVGVGVRIPSRRHLTDGHYWEIASHWATRRAALVKAMRARWSRVDSGTFTMNRYHYYFRCTGTAGPLPA